MKRNRILSFSSAALSVVIIFASAVALFPVGVTSATNVTPMVIPGNPDCSQLAPGTTEFRIEPPANGTFGDGTLTVTINSLDGMYFDFGTTIGVDSVFVKGGPDGNLYAYDPETTGDTGLTAPINPANGNPFELSHISFCYDVDPPTEVPTVIPTEVPTEPPTVIPTEVPTEAPTEVPTEVPTEIPTEVPTEVPTEIPTEEPTLAVFAGCTPGFWKNHTDSWQGYAPDQIVASVFSNVPPELSGDSLLTALDYGGGSGTLGAAQILLRAAVSALLNDAHSEVAYSIPGVINQVNAALASNDRGTMLSLAGMLDGYNNAGCSLN